MVHTLQSTGGMEPHLHFHPFSQSLQVFLLLILNYYEFMRMYGLVYGCSILIFYIIYIYIYAGVLVILVIIECLEKAGKQRAYSTILYLILVLSSLTSIVKFRRRILTLGRVLNLFLNKQFLPPFAFFSGLRKFCADLRRFVICVYLCLSYWLEFRYFLRVNPPHQILRRKGGIFVAEFPILEIALKG